jgi:hypothetical protein
MPNVRRLALVLALLGPAAAALAALLPRAAWGAGRLAVLVLLPIVAGGLASLLVPRGREASTARVAGTGRLHGWIAAAIALDLAPIGLALALGWTALALGDPMQVARRLLLFLLVLPFAIAAATLGSEWALHARLLAPAGRAGRPGEGALLALVAGLALALPALAPGLRLPVIDLALAAAGVVLLREAAAIVLFRAGGLLPAGAWRGTLAALDALLLTEWSPWRAWLAEPAAVAPGFAPLRLLGPAAALVLVAFAARRRAAGPR